MNAVATRARERSQGQALVEFSLVLIPFLFLLMGVIDLGRGIAANNGAAQAAREIARTTSVHPCNPASCTLGNSSETQATISVQKKVALGLGDPAATITFGCTDIAGTSIPNAKCQVGDFIKVTVTVPFTVLTPVLSMVAPATLSSTAHVQIP